MLAPAIELARDGFAASDALAAELQAHVKDVTAPYKYPRIVDFAAELPKTTSGKLQRFLCREALVGGTLEPLAAWNDDGMAERAAS